MNPTLTQKISNTSNITNTSSTRKLSVKPNSQALLLKKFWPHNKPPKQQHNIWDLERSLNNRLMVVNKQFLPKHHDLLSFAFLPPEKQDPAVKYADKKPDRNEWGTGDGGYKSPKDASERMRKNLPYKVKSFV